MGKIPHLAVIYEDRRLIDYSPLNMIRVGSAMRIGIGKFEDFYSTLIGTYGVSEIAFVDGDDAMNGDISPLLKGQDDEYFEDVIFIALGYIPEIGEIEDNYSCENENGRLLTYFNLKNSKKKPKTIAEAININYANLVKPQGKLMPTLKDMLANNIQAIKLMSEFTIDNEEQKKDLYNITCMGDVYRLFIQHQSVIYPNVVFDTTNGEIVIDKGVILKPFTYIEGPCYIGKGSVLEDAKIYGGTSVGDNCFISGVIHNSIVYPNTDIAHNTNIRNSVIGCFSSIGSMSAVENSFDYGMYLGDYAHIKSGSVIGADSKIDFGCSIKTNNIDFPKYIPPFIQGSETGLSAFPLSEFIESVPKINRNIEKFSDSEKNAFESIFNNTKQLREEFFSE